MRTQLMLAKVKGGEGEGMGDMWNCDTVKTMKK